MIVPFIALVVVLALLIFYFIINARNKDKGNRPG